MSSLVENQHVLLRIAASITFGAVSAIAMWRCCLRSPGAQPRWLRGASLAVVILAVFWATVWLVLAASRLSYPFETEWCGGAMKDTVERVLHGQQIYVAPNPGWFPYEYMPLYFFVSSALIRLAHLKAFTGMRLISDASTAASMVLVFAWVRLLQPRRSTRFYWRDQVAPSAAVGIFMAAYRITGAWYDTERLDMLYIALSLAGCYLLERSVRAERRRLAGALALMSAATFALAFLTKQQASLFVISAALALLWLRRWRQAVFFTGACVLLSAVPLWLLNRASHGWLWFYCVHVPLANGTQASLARLFLFRDIPMFAPLLVLTVGGLIILRRTGRLSEPAPSMALSIAAALSAVFQSGISRAHFGGYDNVLITAWVWVPVLACIVADRLRDADDHWLAVAAVPLVLQMLVLTYRPAAQLPTAANFAAGIRFAAAVRRLEERGDVLVQDHGGFTRQPHFQFMALHDVYAADPRDIQSIRQAFVSGRYSAVLMDAYPSKTGLPPELAANYVAIQSLDMNASWCLTGYLTPGPARPVWLLQSYRVPRAKGG